MLLFVYFSRLSFEISGKSDGIFVLPIIAVSDVMTENVEALARDETSSGYAEVSCVYEDVVNSDSLVVKVHSRSCSGGGRSGLLL